MTDEEQEALFADFEPTGCANEGFEASSSFAEQEEFFTTFQDQLEELDERVQSDPRILALQSDLVTCLADGGVTVSDGGDLFGEFFERFGVPAEEIAFGSSDAFEESFEDPFAGVDIDSLSEEEINAILEESGAFESPELGAEQRAQLAELQSEEIEVAQIVIGCDPSFLTGFGGLGDDAYVAVVSEYEQEFLDNNAEALAQFEGIGSR